MMNRDNEPKGRVRLGSQPKHYADYKAPLAHLKRMAVMIRRLKRGEPLKDNMAPLITE